MLLVVMEVLVEVLVVAIQLVRVLQGKVIMVAHFQVVEAAVAAKAKLATPMATWLGVTVLTQQ